MAGRLKINGLIIWKSVNIYLNLPTCHHAGIAVMMPGQKIRGVKDNGPVGYCSTYIN